MNSEQKIREDVNLGLKTKRAEGPVALKNRPSTFKPVDICPKGAINSKKTLTKSVNTGFFPPREKKKKKKSINYRERRSGKK